jgi:hypothetical protein
LRHFLSAATCISITIHVLAFNYISPIGPYISNIYRLNP